MAKVAIVYHSGFGHTKALAEAVERGVRTVAGTESWLLPVSELPPPDKDRQFGGKWGVLDGADAIIFGCPTYMGSISAEFKKFMESSSSKWFAQLWKDKVAAGFTNSGGMSGDKLNSMLDLVVFAGQHSMVWVSQGIMPSSTVPGDKRDLNRISSWLGAMSQSGNESPEVTPPKSDRDTAELFGRRVAEATHRWLRGRG
ncbi:MAG: flavodoxin family protein [Planctomycetes bacterium]|nr:flavodoxin family protein [Planctomycetota bacterium]